MLRVGDKVVFDVGKCKDLDEWGRCICDNKDYINKGGILTVTSINPGVKFGVNVAESDSLTFPEYELTKVL